MENIIQANDNLSFKEDHNKFGLHGHVSIYRENMETGEVSLWDEGDNTITISGSQWIFEKMFNLYLDSKHNASASQYEVLGKDSNLIMPDLNAKARLSIGKPVSAYTPMNEDITSNHFVQGFMIGNQGGAEDGITTKNTDYSFISLRNPIPFQQTNQDSLEPSIAGKYLGISNVTSTGDNNPFSKSYYIKKFDERPHIYHSWWRDNQKWDYVDPVKSTDLGPHNISPGKSNRIESYIECRLSLSDNDCFAYFEHVGSTQTPAINELGLVAFDVDPGARSDLEKCHDTDISTIISFIFDNKREETVIPEIITLAGKIIDVLSNITVGSETKSIKTFGNENINAFYDTLVAISRETEESLTNDKLMEYQTTLSGEDNIGVEAFYNQNGTFIYSTDKFVEYISGDEFNLLSTDEAQRIKLITYYTFNSIPLQKNWRTIIYYRIYAN